jgi:hypothetical protein
MSVAASSEKKWEEGEEFWGWKVKGRKDKIALAGMRMR